MLVPITLVQIILFLAHYFLLHTWLFFLPGLCPEAASSLRIVVLLLAFTFVPATVLSFRFAYPTVHWFYTAAATWLGFANFLFIAACLTWPLWYALRFAGLDTGINPHTLRLWVGGVPFCLGLLAGIVALINARVIRVHGIAVRLPNLPASWRGRTAVLMSDLHLGPVNGLDFSRRVATMAAALKPDIVFVPGDLFDGTKVNIERLLSPFKQLKPPFGVYFCTGNHEEMGSPAPYTDAIARAGIRVLSLDCIVVDGLQVAGISYGASSSPQLKAGIESMRLDTGVASILLHHVPTRLPLFEASGFNLQLSGHTHRGQVFPFTWLTRRIFAEFCYGLHPFGKLQVYTSSGVGTWGPPMRLGNRPEIVLLTFE